jgi:hypothetical protein
VKDEFFHPASRCNDEIDVLDPDVAVRQPGPRIGDEPPESGDALDTPADRVMQQRLAGE